MRGGHDRAGHRREQHLDDVTTIMRLVSPTP
jgi:hypothetical protein